MLQNETDEGVTTCLAIIADDITGSFDTGVQFQKRGSSVRFALGTQLPESLEGAQVLVIDAETRHASADETYSVIYRLARWTVQMGIPHLYIKTDSGLRGHVGMALKAALDAVGCPLCGFAPAYPDMDRITRNGQQIISGVPLHCSVFAQDPFDPVSMAGIRDMLLPCGVDVKEMKQGEAWDTQVKSPTVAVFDTVCNEEFDRIALHLQAMGQLRLTAGCAAFAAHLPQVLGLPDLKEKQQEISRPLLVICGSLNPISKAQLAFEEKNGGVRFSISPDHLLDETYFDSAEGMMWLDELRVHMKESRTLLVDTVFQDDYQNAAATAKDNNRIRIAAQLGRLMLELVSGDESEGYLPMIIGGDTLMGFLNQLPTSYVMLEGETLPGVVRFSIGWRENRLCMLSKSGGFGRETLLQDILTQQTIEA